MRKSLHIFILSGAELIMLMRMFYQEVVPIT